MMARMRRHRVAETPATRGHLDWRPGPREVRQRGRREQRSSSTGSREPDMAPCVPISCSVMCSSAARFLPQAGLKCNWGLQARPGEEDDDRTVRRHLPRSAYRKPLVQSDDDDDAAEASEDAAEAGQDEAQRTPSRKLPPPVSARCTKQDCNRVEGSMSAGLDIVTLERLCAVHVCIVSPDGQTRLCYNANTLQARHLHASAVCRPPCIRARKQLSHRRAAPACLQSTALVSVCSRLPM